jgi:hypothetical protein
VQINNNKEKQGLWLKRQPETFKTSLEIREIRRLNESRRVPAGLPPIIAYTEHKYELATSKGINMHRKQQES